MVELPSSSDPKNALLCSAMFAPVFHVREEVHDLLSPVQRVGSEVKTMELDAEQRLETVLGKALTDRKVQASGTPQHTLIPITWP